MQLTVKNTAPILGHPAREARYALHTWENSEGQGNSGSICSTKAPTEGALHPSSSQGWRWDRAPGHPGAVTHTRAASSPAPVVPGSTQTMLWMGKPEDTVYLRTRAVTPRMAVRSPRALQIPRAAQLRGPLRFLFVRKGVATCAGWNTEHNKHLPKLNITLPSKIRTLLL